MGDKNILPRNDVVYQSKDEAVQAMKQNVLGLAYGEQGICKYVDPSNPDVVGIIQGVGTGTASQPTVIINQEGTAYQRGMNPPTDESQWWIDTRMTGLSLDEDSILQKIYGYIQNMNNRLEKIEYAFNFGMDCGDTKFTVDDSLMSLSTVKPKTIDEILDDEHVPSWDDYSGPAKLIEGKDGDPKAWVDQLYPNVRHFCIKHDTSENLANYVPRDWELIGCDDLKCVYIGYDGKYLKITGTAGGDNPDPENPDPTKPMEYLDLLTEDKNVTIRMKASADGNIRVYNAAEDDESIVQAGGAGSGERNKGLVISMVYAGKPNATKSTFGICSHSFVELFNGSENDINLRGLSLQIGTTSTNWNVIPLKGIVRPGHCFLIRCNACADPASEKCLINIDKYDLDAPTAYMNCNGVKLYLCVGTDPCTVDNPWTNVSGASLPDNYIDLVGLRKRLKSGEAYGDGAGQFPNINGFETVCADVLDETMGAFRCNLLDIYANAKTKVTYGDTNNNQIDFRSFDYNSNVVTPYPEVMYKPWTRADGKLTMYRTFTKISEEAPDMVTIAIGSEATTRTFNWISREFNRQYLYYREAGVANWTQIESGQDADHANIRVNAADGTQFMTHKVVVEGLTAGKTYEYKVGRPGFISDEYTFEVNTASTSNTGSFKFVQISDQQGWVFSEYSPWGYAFKNILKLENNGMTNKFPANDNGIHFFVNTGDMSQNGSRPSEWLDYYHQADPYFPFVPQMNTVGNNDLCPSEDGSAAKALSTSFVYYYNYQMDKTNPQKDSKGDRMRSVYGFDYGCAHFICLNSNEWIEDQKAWFTAHITAVKARPNPPAWIIVYVHDAPFNITTSTDPQALPGKDTGHRDSPINDATNGTYTKRYAWSRLFEDNGVDLVLSGHKHTYSRTYPLKEDRSEITIAGWNVADPRLPVNYLVPLTQAADDGGKTTFTQQKGFIPYCMCQATGFKLSSNKDVPAANVSWLASYFPGSGGKSSKAQMYPTYIVYEITPTQITMKAMQVKNVCNGGKFFDSYGLGEPGVTKLDEITSTEIDRFVFKKPAE